METIVGIDLGTTNSEVACIIDGKAEILTDRDNGIMPSCVGLDAAGGIIVGTEARNQMIVAPDRTVSSVKRRMGDKTPIPLGNETYQPQEISAFILKALKNRAEKALGHPVSRAVITVPAYFNDGQRQATREAGQIAGLEVVRIINEPTAAALAYENRSGDTARVLVYDLGGGTFDVSIVRIENGVVEVMASTGDNQLGGDDFDQKLADHLAARIRSEHDADVRVDPAAMHRLKRAAESAKIALSSQPYTMIEEDHIAESKSGPVHLSTELSRAEFEDIIEADLNRTMDAVGKALKDAQSLPSAIDRIILVGGSTRIPMVARLLEEKIGITPHDEIDPDLCVALGASLQAGREMGKDDAGVLIDVTPYSFGTSVLDEMDGEMLPYRFIPVIKRNTKLPASRSEAFYTVHEGQEAVEIKIFQGEDTDCRNNICIGTYMFDLSGLPAGSPVTLRLDLDINGILNIEAVEKPTGNTIKAVIDNAFSRLDDEAIADSEQRINRLFDDRDDGASGTDASAENGGMPSETAGLIRRAQDALDKAPPEDSDEIINLIEDIRDAADAGRMADLKELSNELEDILFYLD